MFLYAFQLWQGSGEQLMRSAISAEQQLSSIQKKETGIWSGIIPQPSSCVTCIISRI